MGNRALVVFHDGNKDKPEVGPAVYLHWNGGPESIEGFLNEMDRRKIRKSDIEYTTARFVHIVCDFFDQEEAGTTSVGVRNGPKDLSPGELVKFAYEDNGLYLVEPARAEQRIKNGFHIRRFTGNGDDPATLEEMSPRAVKNERHKARLHEYNTPHPKQGADGKVLVGEFNETMADTFVKLRPKVSTYG